jgi:hypothetical protein
MPLLQNMRVRPTGTDTTLRIPWTGCLSPTGRKVGQAPRMRGATARWRTTGERWLSSRHRASASSPVAAQRPAPRLQPSRAEQSRAEQSRAEQSRAEQHEGNGPARGHGPSPGSYHLDPWLQPPKGGGYGPGRDNAERSLLGRRHSAGRQPGQAGPGRCPVVWPAASLGQGGTRRELQRCSGRQVHRSPSGRRSRQGTSHIGVQRSLRFRGLDAMLAPGVRHHSGCTGSGYEVVHGAHGPLVRGHP